MTRSPAKWVLERRPVLGEHLAQSSHGPVEQHDLVRIDPRRQLAQRDRHRRPRVGRSVLEDRLARRPAATGSRRGPGSPPRRTRRRPRVADLRLGQRAGPDQGGQAQQREDPRQVRIAAVHAAPSKSWARMSASSPYMNTIAPKHAIVRPGTGRRRTSCTTTPTASASAATVPRAARCPGRTRTPPDALEEEPGTARAASSVNGSRAVATPDRPRSGTTRRRPGPGRTAPG